MCGIGGIFLQSEVTLSDLRERLEAMGHAMLHRGQDDAGTYLMPHGRGGLINRRLAIRDLSPAAHMPMGNEEGTVWITYNGEIYNTGELRPELERLGYNFRSSSDTEIILYGYQAWGTGVVERLRGIFAFAILDIREPGGHLFLARDRLGVKPLYYATTPEALLFASELKGMLASGLTSREMSPAGLVGYLMMGSVPNPLTIYRDIRGLEPGCTLSIALDVASASPSPMRYWCLPTDIQEPTDDADVVEQVRALLEDAVRMQLVSDVPLGAFLSGGLDSSAVVALMRKATDGPIRTCSMVFEEAGYSEAPYARAMAEAAGTDHYERVITAGDIGQELDNILQAMDQPTIDGVNTYFVSQTAREAGLTVALSGLGGDELFRGYANTFQGVPQLMRALKTVQSVPGGATLASSVIALWSRRGRWAKLHDALTRPASPASAYLARRGLFSPSEVRRLVRPDVWREAAGTFDAVEHVDERAIRNGRDSSFAGQPSAWISRAELGTYTHDQLLRDTDVMSMAHSLEVRVPLLDHRLVEGVLRLSETVKANGHGPKSLLLEALGPDLPAPVRDRSSKQGFTFPLDPWLCGPLKRTVAPLLGDAVAGRRLQERAVSGIWQAFQAGRIHWSRPWALAVVAQWAA